MTGGNVGHLVLATNWRIPDIIAGAGRIAGGAVARQGTIVNVDDHGTFISRAADEGIGQDSGHREKAHDHVPSGHIASPGLIAGYDEAGEQDSHGGEGQGHCSGDHG